MASFQELAGVDPRLQQLRLVITIFIAGPLVFSIVTNPANWLATYGRAMLYAFSLPLLVLVVMVFNRKKRLSRLAECGVQIDAVVERTWRHRSEHFGTVRFLLNGIEQRVTLRVRDDMLDRVYESSRIALLVDPERPENAVVLTNRSI